MDKTEPADQGLLRHQRECREDPNLDRRDRLPVGRHHEKAPPDRGQSLHNSTGSERLLVRENQYKSASCKVERQTITSRNR